MGMGGAQLGKTEMEEIRIGYVIAAGDGNGVVGHAGNDLAQHHVNAGHVLPVQCTEEVTAAGEAGMEIVVFNDVADVSFALPGITRLKLVDKNLSYLEKPSTRRLVIELIIFTFLSLALIAFYVFFLKDFVAELNIKIW
jgi:hypothetical protein